MRITRLGQGVDATGRARARGHRADNERAPRVSAARWTSSVSSGFASPRHRRRATPPIGTSSSTPRRQLVGARPELLSGKEEGNLSFLGATADVDKSGGPVPRRRHRRRVDRVHRRDRRGRGCHLDRHGLRAADGEGAAPRSAAARGAEHRVVDGRRRISDDVRREVPAVADAKTFIGVAGTITTVAAVEIGLEEYDRDAIHHFRLTHAAAEDVFRTLATESREARIANPGPRGGPRRRHRRRLLHPRRHLPVVRLRRVPRLRVRHPRRPAVLAPLTARPNVGAIVAAIAPTIDPEFAVGVRRALTMAWSTNQPSGRGWTRTCSSPAPVR